MLRQNNILASILLQERQTIHNISIVVRDTGDLTVSIFINLFYGVGMATKVNLLVVQNMQVMVYPMHQQTDYSVTVQVSQVQAGII